MAKAAWQQRIDEVKNMGASEHPRLFKTGKARIVMLLEYIENGGDIEKIMGTTFKTKESRGEEKKERPKKKVETKKKAAAKKMKTNTKKKVSPKKNLSQKATNKKANEADVSKENGAIGRDQGLYEESLG